METYPKIAKRVILLDSANPGLIGIGFSATHTGVDVHPGIEDHFLTVGVAKFAVAELYLRLKERIDSNPTEYGFMKAE